MAGAQDDPGLKPARPAPRQDRSPRAATLRSLGFQLLGLLLLGLLIGWLVHNTRTNLAARGIQGGWDFLGQTAGFDIGEHLIAYAPEDSHLRAFMVGLLNTLRVAVAGIVAATLGGLLLGVASQARHLLLRGLARAYVECFRNVPLLVQLLAWYLMIVEGLPELAEAWSLPGLGLLLSKSGLALPWPQRGGEGFAWSLPVVQGFSIEGGAVLSPEFLAVWLGLSAYTAAFIGEVVRAGLVGVPQGQTEAALSLGLGRGQLLRRVTLPLAMRLIVPPLGNQYLNLTKNSSLAVAVGYPDLVSVANTTLNQTGRAVECIVLILLIYLGTSLLTALGIHLYNRRVALVER